MSHSTVLVIGPDPEEQLKPFDENIEGPRRVDETYDLLELATRSLEFQRQHYPDTVEKFKDYEASTLGIAQRKELASMYLETEDIEFDGNKVLRYTTYNIKSRWDWYSIGGRWRGFFTLKPEGVGPVPERHYSETSPLFNKSEELEDLAGLTDQAVKGDIDFEAMRDKRREQAEKDYDAVAARTEGIAPPERNFASQVDEVLKELGVSMDIKRDHPLFEISENMIAEVRKAYFKHPWYIAAKGDEFFWGDIYDEFFVGHDDPRQAYIDSKVNAVGVPFAILKDGEWYERGKMGWWGMVSDEKSEAEWHKKCSELIDSLPDDTLLTLVDVHI